MLHDAPCPFWKGYLVYTNRRRAISHSATYLSVSVTFICSLCALNSITRRPESALPDHAEYIEWNFESLSIRTLLIPLIPKFRQQITSNSPYNIWLCVCIYTLDTIYFGQLSQLNNTTQSGIRPRRAFLSCPCVWWHSLGQEHLHTTTHRNTWMKRS